MPSSDVARVAVEPATRRPTGPARPITTTWRDPPAPVPPRAGVDHDWPVRAWSGDHARHQFGTRSVLQRQCACASDGGSCSCPTPDDAHIQTLREPGAETVDADAVPDVRGGLGGGRPLNAVIRAEMEARLHDDFSSVRIHTDRAAAASAASVGARAFTVGNDVVFGVGAYAPGTPTGRRTLVHELVHVQQQRRGPVTGVPVGGGLSVSDPGDRFEREADAVADRALRRPLLPVAGPTSGTARGPAMSEPDRRPEAGGPTRAPTPTRGPTLQRACLSAEECTRRRSSMGQFVQETVAKQANKVKAERRAANCDAGKPECTSDGHAAVASGLVAFMKERLASRLDHVSGIFVNKDIPAEWGAVTVPCASFKPPLPVTGGRTMCVTVPASLEAQAQQYVGTHSDVIGGRSRYAWVTRALRIMTHETEHGRFEVAVSDPAKTPLTQPSAGSCSPSDVAPILTEMVAQMAEFPVVLGRMQPQTDDVQKRALASWFSYHINNRKEDMTGILAELRCTCECADADQYLKTTAANVQANWNSYQKSEYNTEMKRPVHRLNWPVDPPDAVDVYDLPSVVPHLDVEDLPFSK